MLRKSFVISLLLSGFLSFLACGNAMAQEQQAQGQVQETTTTTTTTTNDGTVTKVVETRRDITTPVPAAKETVATPAGFVTCFTVNAGWFNNIWIPTHRVCQYENTAEGVAWVEGYWGCNKSTAEGVCTNWEWKPGHWVKSLTVY